MSKQRATPGQIGVVPITTGHNSVKRAGHTQLQGNTLSNRRGMYHHRAMLSQNCAACLIRGHLLVKQAVHAWPEGNACSNHTFTAGAGALVRHAPGPIPRGREVLERGGGREGSEGGRGGLAGTPLLLGCPSTFSTFMLSSEKIENFFLCSILPTLRVTLLGFEPAPATLEMEIYHQGTDSL